MNSRLVQYEFICQIDFLFHLILETPPPGYMSEDGDNNENGQGMGRFSVGTSVIQSESAAVIDANYIIIVLI